MHLTVKSAALSVILLVNRMTDRAAKVAQKQV